MRKQVPLYSWTQRRLTLAERPLSLELSTFNYLLLGNDGAISDAIFCELCFNFIDESRTATYHFNGGEGVAAGEHVAHLGDSGCVEVT